MGFSRGLSLEVQMGFSRGLNLEVQMGFSSSLEVQMGFSRGLNLEVKMGFLRETLKQFTCKINLIKMEIALVQIKMGCL
jgi:hypothetical protein